VIAGCLRTELCNQINYMWTFYKCVFTDVGKWNETTFLRKTCGPRDSLDALENKRFLYPCHTLLKLLMHPVHYVVTTPATDLCFTVFMKHKKRFLTPQEWDYVFWSHVTAFFLLSNIFYMFLFSFYICQINSCPFASEYTSRVQQSFNNSLLYFKSLELMSGYKPFSRKSYKHTATDCTNSLHSLYSCTQIWPV